MSVRRDYDIAFVGLKPGLHEFVYEVDDQFFADYQDQDFHHCLANVRVTLDKRAGFMLLKFEVGGKVEATCDRCGNGLALDLWDEFNLVVKLVDDPDLMNDQEEDPDIHYIGKGESHLHLADWLYEFINLSLPMQRLCPPDPSGEPGCDKQALAVLERMRDEHQAATNPLWKGLEKFRDLGN